MRVELVLDISITSWLVLSNRLQIMVSGVCSLDCYKASIPFSNWQVTIGTKGAVQLIQTWGGHWQLFVLKSWKSLLEANLTESIPVTSCSSRIMCVCLFLWRAFAVLISDQEPSRMSRAASWTSCDSVLKFRKAIILWNLLLNAVISVTPKASRFT